jgi:hypothetical protein
MNDKLRRRPVRLRKRRSPKRRKSSARETITAKGHFERPMRPRHGEPVTMEGGARMLAGASTPHHLLVKLSPDFFAN